MNEKIKSSKIHNNNDLYQEVAKSYLLQFTKQLVSSLKTEKIIHIENGLLSEKDLNTVYIIGFNILATLEDLNGFSFLGEKWFITAIFSTEIPTGSNSVNYLGSINRIALHGALNDEIIQLAAKSIT